MTAYTLLQLSGVIILIFLYLYISLNNRFETYKKRVEQQNKEKDSLNEMVTNIARMQQKLVEDMNKERKGIFKMYDN